MRYFRELFGTGTVPTTRPELKLKGEAAKALYKVIAPDGEPDSCTGYDIYFDEGKVLQFDYHYYRSATSSYQDTAAENSVSKQALDGNKVQNVIEYLRQHHQEEFERLITESRVSEEDLEAQEEKGAARQAEKDRFKEEQLQAAQEAREKFQREKAAATKQIPDASQASIWRRFLPGSQASQAQPAAPQPVVAESGPSGRGSTVSPQSSVVPPAQPQNPPPMSQGDAKARLEAMKASFTISNEDLSSMSSMRQGKEPAIEDGKTLTGTGIVYLNKDGVLELAYQVATEVTVTDEKGRQRVDRDGRLQTKQEIESRTIPIDKKGENGEMLYADILFQYEQEIERIKSIRQQYNQERGFFRRVGSWLGKAILGRGIMENLRSDDPSDRRAAAAKIALGAAPYVLLTLFAPGLGIAAGTALLTATTVGLVVVPALSKGLDYLERNFPTSPIVQGLSKVRSTGRGLFNAFVKLGPDVLNSLRLIKSGAERLRTEKSLEGLKEMGLGLFKMVNSLLLNVPRKVINGTLKLVARVTGTVTYKDWKVQKASAISKGDQLEDIRAGLKNKWREQNAQDTTRLHETIKIGDQELKEANKNCTRSNSVDIAGAFACVILVIVLFFAGLPLVAVAAGLAVGGATALHYKNYTLDNQEKRDNLADTIKKSRNELQELSDPELALQSTDPKIQQSAQQHIAQYFGVPVETVLGQPTYNATMRHGMEAKELQEIASIRSASLAEVSRTTSVTLDVASEQSESYATTSRSASQRSVAATDSASVATQTTQRKGVDAQQPIPDTLGGMSEEHLGQARSLGRRLTVQSLGSEGTGAPETPKSARGWARS